MPVPRAGFFGRVFGRVPRAVSLTAPGPSIFDGRCLPIKRIGNSSSSTHRWCAGLAVVKSHPTLISAPPLPNGQ